MSNSDSSFSAETEYVDCLAGLARNKPAHIAVMALNTRRRVSTTVKMGAFSENAAQRTYGKHGLQLAGAWTAIVLGIVVSSMNLVHSNAYLLTLGPALGCAGAITLVLHHSEPPPRGVKPVSDRVVTGLQVSFWSLLGLAILITHDAVTQRPLIFFIVVSLACMTLAMQLSGQTTTRNTALFFCGALMLSLVTRGSVFFLTPGFPGSDAWSHETLIQAVLRDGHVPTEWDPPYYLHYSATHLTVASTATILGVSSKLALFVSVGIPLALSVLSVALIARRLGGVPCAFLAALLALFASYHLQWGTQIIPTSMGLSLFSVVLAVVLSQPHSQSPRFFLVSLFAVVLVLCHTVSTFILWTALCVLAAATIAIPKTHDRVHPWERGDGTVFFLVLLTVVMFTHWNLNTYTNAGASFFEQMIRTSLDSLVGDAGFLDRPTEGGAFLGQQLLAVSGFALFYCLIALGALRQLEAMRQNAVCLRAVLVVAILSVVAFAFPLFGVRNILPHRWFGFIWVVGAELAASGLLSMMKLMQRASAAIVAGAAVVGVLVFLMVTAPVSNTDSPVYGDQITQRLIYHESELDAARWLSEFCSGSYASDLQFGQRVLHDHLGLPSVVTTLTDQSSLSGSHYIWRATALSRPIQIHDGSNTILGPIHIASEATRRPMAYCSVSVHVLLPSTIVLSEETINAS